MIYQIAYLFFENRSHNKLEYNASTAHEEREREISGKPWRQD